MISPDDTSPGISAGHLHLVLGNGFEGTDLALISAPQLKDVGFLRTMDGQLAVGTPSVAYGFDRSGVLRELSGAAVGAKSIELSPGEKGVSPGMSGGPIVVDGRIAGVITASAARQGRLVLQPLHSESTILESVTGRYSSDAGPNADASPATPSWVLVGLAVLIGVALELRHQMRLREGRLK
jgi:hypothetical protein